MAANIWLCVLENCWFDLRGAKVAQIRFQSCLGLQLLDQSALCQRPGIELSMELKIWHSDEHNHGFLGR